MRQGRQRQNEHGSDCEREELHQPKSIDHPTVA